MTPKEQGIKKVTENNLTDHQVILSYAREWVKNKMKPFTSDDLRNDYEENNTAPGQPKVYGAVFNSLFKEKCIIQNGTKTSTRPKAHGRLIRVWISVEYSMKQAANRSKQDSQINIFDL